MLILGIESGTVQVGGAIGGHEGVLAQAHSARGQAPRREPDAGDRLRAPPGARRPPRDQLRRGRPRPGLFTGLRVGVASAKAMAHALRVPMIGVPSLDLLAFPVRFSPRLIVAAIDARRGELFYAFYRRCPAACSGSTPHRVGTPDDLASELLASGEECLLVGDGALRYREVFDGLTKVEIADSGLAYPSASSLVQLAHAQALREQLVKPWDLEPLYLRKPDAEINWSTRDDASGDLMAARVPAIDRTCSRCASRRCGAGTCAACCASRTRCIRGRGRSGCS